MKHTLTYTVLASLCALLYCGSALGATAIISSDDDLIISARAIITARVVKSAAQLYSGSNEVFTYTTLKIESVLKGQLPYREVVLKEEGGVTPTRITDVPGTPEFQAGQEVLLYLDTRKDGSLRVHQMFLGRFAIVKDAATGKRFVDRGIPSDKVDIRGREPGNITDRAEMAAYVQMVAARLAANQKASDDFQAKYYGSLPMLQSPREYSISGQPGLTPEFTLFPGQVVPGRWFEPDQGQPIQFVMNTAEQPLPNSAADIQAAMQAWESVLGTLLNLELAGNVTACFSVDGPVMIVFNDCDDRFPPATSCGGIIGMGGISRDPTQTTVVNGTTFDRVTGGFMSFNPSADTCSFTNDCDLQEVATHEMGHSLGLGHSWQPSFPGNPTPIQAEATMYFSPPFDNRCAAVESDDIAGITFIYPASSGNIQITNNSVLGAATIGVPYSQTMQASGVAPYTWSIPAFKGQLPPGLSLSSAGLISGTPSQAGTFNFTLQVVDSAPEAAQASFTITVTPPALSLVTASLPYAIEGEPYLQQLMATGGTPPYTWSIGSGTLPAGLTLSGSGSISGKPTSAGTFTFQGQVADASSNRAGEALQLSVVPPSAVPHISTLKFKSAANLLTVTGQHFDSKATLLVDSSPVAVKTNKGNTITAVLTGLSAGIHQAAVVDSNGVQSNSEQFTAN